MEEKKTPFNNRMFNLLMNHIGSDAEITLSNGEIIYGRLVSFNKYPLTLQIEHGSLHIINFSYVIQIRFAKPKGNVPR